MERARWAWSAWRAPAARRSSTQVPRRAGNVADGRALRVESVKGARCASQFDEGAAPERQCCGWTRADVHTVFLVCDIANVFRRTHSVDLCVRWTRENFERSAKRGMRRRHGNWVGKGSGLKRADMLNGARSPAEPGSRCFVQWWSGAGKNAALRCNAMLVHCALAAVQHRAISVYRRSPPFSATQ